MHIWQLEPAACSVRSAIRRASERAVQRHCAATRARGYRIAIFRRGNGEALQPPRSVTVLPYIYDAEQSQCGSRDHSRRTVFSNNAGHAPVIGVGSGHRGIHLQPCGYVHSRSSVCKNIAVFNATLFWRQTQASRHEGLKSTATVAENAT